MNIHIGCKTSSQRSEHRNQLRCALDWFEFRLQVMLYLCRSLNIISSIYLSNSSKRFEKLTFLQIRAQLNRTTSTGNSMWNVAFSTTGVQTNAKVIDHFLKTALCMSIRIFKHEVTHQHFKMYNATGASTATFTLLRFRFIPSVDENAARSHCSVFK